MQDEFCAIQIWVHSQLYFYMHTNTYTFTYYIIYNVLQKNIHEIKKKCKFKIVYFEIL